MFLGQREHFLLAAEIILSAATFIFVQIESRLNSPKKAVTFFLTKKKME